MWTLLREVSLRHLRHAPLRTSLVVVGIALGVCMLSAIVATNRSLAAAFEDMVERVSGTADLTVAGSEAGIPSSLTAQIAEVDGVAHAAAMLEVTTRTPNGQGGAILVLGVDFLGDTFFLPFTETQTTGHGSVVEDPLSFVSDPTAILVSKKLAQSRHLQRGDALTLMTAEGPRDFKVYGLLENTGPAASFGGQVAVMFIDAAQVSFSRGYAVDRIDVAVAKTHSQAEVQRSIQQLVDGIARVEEPRHRGRRLVSSLWAFQRGLDMTGLAALWVGMFLIYNAVSVSVAQRRREVGVLRALGVSQREMVALFCAEATIMAGFGVGLGLLAAHFVAQFALASVGASVDQFILPIAPPPARIDAHVAGLGAAAGFSTTLLAAYLPARRASKVHPAEAVRAARNLCTAAQLPTAKLAVAGLVLATTACILALQGGEPAGYAAAITVTAGFALMVPSAIVALRRLGLPPTERLWGVPGRLALDNVERSLGRSTVTVVQLVLAVAMSTTLSAWTNSFEHALFEWSENAFPADVVVTAGSPLVDKRSISFGPEVLPKLQGLDGVRTMYPVRIADQDVGMLRAQLMATDTRTYFEQSQRKGISRRVLEGPERLAVNTLHETPSLIISENLSTRQDLHPGDTLSLRTPLGLQTFRIAAVVVDYSSDQGWAMIDLRWYTKFWRDNQIDQVDLYLDPGADAEKVVREVHSRLGGSDALFVTPHEGLRQEIQRETRGLFAYARAPEWVTLLVALMGVIGTMLAAVLDRTREVGMLRAVGATRRQVAQSVVLEAAFLGSVAAVWGVATGIAQGLLFVKVVSYASSGWNLPYELPLSTTLRVCGLIVATAALSGFLPGQRAARMDVKRALAYE